jgi:hypothetical protein
MMRAHGIAPNAASIKPAPARAPKSERRESGPSLKKRKADQFLEDTPVDDDEGMGWGARTGVVIKEDPREEKYNFKQEDHKPQTIEEQGQLNLEQAANLMQYYDGRSQLVVDDLYGAGDFGGGMSAGVYGTSSGYASPMASAYGLDSQNGYFSASYGSSGMGSSMNGLSSVPRSSPQQSHQYQQYGLPYQRQPDDLGHPDSPLIVE